MGKVKHPQSAAPSGSWKGVPLTFNVCSCHHCRCRCFKHDSLLRAVPLLSAALRYAGEQTSSHRHHLYTSQRISAPVQGSACAFVMPAKTLQRASRQYHCGGEACECPSRPSVAYTPSGTFAGFQRRRSQGNLSRQGPAGPARVKRCTGSFSTQPLATLPSGSAWTPNSPQIEPAPPSR